MDTLVALISDVGFPIAITVFVLYRMERSVLAMTKEIKEFSGLLRAVLISSNGPNRLPK